MGRSGCNSARCNRQNRRARNGPCQRIRIHTVATGVIDNSPAPSRLVKADALGLTMAYTAFRLDYRVAVEQNSQCCARDLDRESIGERHFLETVEAARGAGVTGGEGGAKANQSSGRWTARGR